MKDSKREPAPLGADDYFRFVMQAERKRQGWTQAGFASDLEASGGPAMHQQTIQKIESGTRPVKLAEANAIAKLLNMRLDDMLDGVADNVIEEADKELEQAQSKVYQGMADLWARQLVVALVLDAYEAAGINTWSSADVSKSYEEIHETALTVWEHRLGLEPVRRHAQQLLDRATDEMAAHVSSKLPALNHPGQHVKNFYSAHPDLVALEQWRFKASGDDSEA